MEDSLKKPGTQIAEPLWHAMSAQEVFEYLKSTSQGLTETEVVFRRKQYGLNKLREVRPTPAWLRFLRQFHNVLIYILLVSSVISIFLKHWMDLSVILAVVLLNAIIGFIQEDKAEKALKAIRHMLSPQANVIRDGRTKTILAKFLVPGDVVWLQSGDKVPADLRLCETKHFQIQESILTGESQPVDKKISATAETATLGDRTSMVYSSTTVTYGRAKGIVVAIGKNTELGRINALISEVVSHQTRFLKQLTIFGRWLTVAIVGLALFVFAIGSFVWQESASEMLMAAIGLAVAAIPEGLPAVITIILAVGATRMAKRHAIVRRLPAIETMGSVTTICTDKTGTLTYNELAVTEVVTAERYYYLDKENIALKFEENKNWNLEGEDGLKVLVHAAVLNNDAQAFLDNEKWELLGNPVDKALLSLGLNLTLDPAFEKEAFPRTDVIPFESQHKFMASLHHDHKGHGYVFIKGAPEKIMTRCSHQYGRLEFASMNNTYWSEALDQMAEKGQRVLALAMKKTPSTHRELEFRDVEKDFVLIGFVGLSDPPRQEAIEAVAQCHAAGINVKMITGDHAITAKSIAKAVGIVNSDVVITGEELDQMDDDYLKRIVLDSNIYARTSPEHKLRLVRALQSYGDIVGMTGDGVNDAPALRQADVGIAMGQKGTEATKDVAEMVLADDNFASIAHAIEEGRTVYDNLKKAILYILPTSGGEAFIITIAVLFGLLLPITPVQILWVNMITATTFGLTLSFEPPEEHVMYRPPRKLNEPILSLLLIWRIVFVSLLMVAAGFGLYLYELHMGAPLNVARTVVVNMLVTAEAVYLFNCRKLMDSCMSLKVLLGNKYILVSILIVAVFQGLFTYLPGMERFFGVLPINIMAWVRIIILAIIIFILVELEKKAVTFFLKRFKKEKT